MSHSPCSPRTTDGGSPIHREPQDPGTPPPPSDSGATTPRDEDEDDAESADGSVSRYFEEATSEYRCRAREARALTLARIEWEATHAGHPHHDEWLSLPLRRPAVTFDLPVSLGAAHEALTARASSLIGRLDVAIAVAERDAAARSALENAGAPLRAETADTD